MSTHVDSPRLDRFEESRFGRALGALPDRITLLFLAASLAITVALIVQQFVWWLVVPLFVVAAAVLWRFLPAPARTGRRQGVGGAVSVFIALVWVVGNIPFASQLVWVTRDPGIYTVLGMWLTHHRSIGVDVSAAAGAANGLSDYTNALGAFVITPSDQLAHIQGGALLPGFLGVGGWIAGEHGVLWANIVIGGIAMISMYALARRFARPWIAIAVELGLGFSIAFVYLMRAPYSESIMFIVCAAGVVWLVAGWQQRSPRLYGVAGIFLGSSSFARVDGPLALIGPVVALGAAAVIVSDRERFRTLAVGAYWFFGLGLVTELIGYLSLWVNERGYLMMLTGNVGSLLAAMVAVMIVALVLIVVRVRRTQSSGLSEKALGRWGIGLGVFVPVLFVVWLSRPLWWHGHFLTGGYVTSVANMQKAEGLPVDGTMSYDEHSLFWVAWYFGWPMVAFAGLGLGAMLWWGLKKRDLGLLFLVCSTLAGAVLYLDYVGITPDQVWAYRRLLPIITSGFLVGAAYLVEGIARRDGDKWLSRSVAVVAAGLVAFAPIVPYSGLMKVADGQGELAFADGLCAKITAPDVLLVTNGAPANIALTVRVMCDVNVVSGNPKDPAQLAELQRRWPKLQVIVFAKGAMDGTAELGAPDVAARIVRWQTSLVSIPKALTGLDFQAWVGTIRDGRFVAAH